MRRLRYARWSSSVCWIWASATELWACWNRRISLVITASEKRYLEWIETGLLPSVSLKKRIRISPKRSPWMAALYKDGECLAQTRMMTQDAL